MTQYILDTDHVTLFQHGHPKIIRRTMLVGISNIFITTVTLQEQLQGRLAVINRVGTQPERFANTYANLRATLVFFCNINLLDFNDEAYNCYQSLRQRKIRIGTQDLKIASIALANQLTLATRNYQDFSKISALIVEDWTVI